MDVAYLKILCDFASKVGAFEERDEVSFGTFLGSCDWRLEAKVWENVEQKPRKSYECLVPWGLV